MEYYEVVEFIREQWSLFPKSEVFSRKPICDNNFRCVAFEVEHYWVLAIIQIGPRGELTGEVIAIDPMQAITADQLVGYSTFTRYDYSIDLVDIRAQRLSASDLVVACERELIAFMGWASANAPFLIGSLRAPDEVENPERMQIIELLSVGDASH